MLRAFRNASHSWFIKILFSAIIFSFCLWGVGDIIRNYSASQPVVKVNKTSVTAESFSREYNQTRQNIKNSGEKALLPEEMKGIDVKGIVLDKIINSAVLEETVKRYGVVIPKKTILKVIESMPEFQKDGVFNSNLYAVLLQRSGLSESMLINNIKENLSRSQLLNPFMSGYKIPTFIKETIAREFDTKKTLVIGYIKLKDIKTDTVDDNDIEEYYNSHKDKYKRSETRDIAVLVIDSSKLVETADITQQETDEYYAANKEAFAPRELRDFERFTFNNAQDADKAWKLLQKGVKTPEIMKNLLPQIETLNAMEKHAFPSEIGSALFSKLMKPQDVSTVYSIGGRYCIYRLLKITRSDEKSKNEINKEIRAIIQNEKANTPEFYQQIKELRNKIDDSFAAGKSIEEIALETKMEIVELKNIKNGVSIQIKNLNLDKATVDELNNAVFTTEEGQSGPIIDSHELDTLSFVVSVKKINKESIPALSEIKQTVKNDCVKSRKNEIAKDKAQDIIAAGDKAVADVMKLTGVRSFTLSKKDIIMDHKIKTKTVSSIAKVIPNLNIVMDILSSSKKGEAKSFNLPDEGYIIIAVKDVSPSKGIDAQFSNIINTYVDNIAKKDMALMAINAFKSQVKIEVNEERLKEITKSVDDEESQE